MSRKPELRAVSEGEKAPLPLTVTEAAKSGDARSLLVSMRDRIALAVENPDTPSRDLAALTKRLMETVREIEAIDARALEEGSDEEVTDGEFDAEAI